MRNSPQINITLPPDVKAASNRYTLANYLTFSQLVRVLLVEKLRKEGYLPEPSHEEVPA